MNVQGITWHAITLEGDKFDAFKKLTTDVLGLSPMVDMEGFSMFAMPNGTMLELYKPANVPSYGFNGSVAFGFRVDDIEAASQQLAEAGYTLLGEIVRMPDINYSYRHFKGPDGVVYGLNEQK